MDRPNRVRPMDPVEFRDACLGMMESAEATGACEPGFLLDLGFAAGYFLDLWFPLDSSGNYAASEASPSGPGEEEFWKYSAACIRLSALIEIVEGGGLGSLESAGFGADEIHVAVLEAAAVCPVDSEGRMDRDEFLREAFVRKRDIDVLSDLLDEM